MGLNELRDDTQRLLRLNYPNSKFSLTGLRKKAWWQFF
jgi:outer membrane protein assembly factor BamD (BamD/ComL family)